MASKFIETAGDTTPEKKSARLEYKRTADKRTKKFMKYVEKFIKEKNGGEIPPEWSCSLMLLETYYNQFIQITEELKDLDSIIIDGKYGPQPSALLGAQQTCSIRIENYMKEFGLTMKSAKKMGVKEVKEEQSVLETFLNKKNSGK